MGLINHPKVLGFNIPANGLKQAADQAIIKKLEQQTLYKSKDPLKETIIIISGDSDFIQTIKSIKSKGYKVLLIFSKNSTSRKLLNSVDEYISVCDLLPKFKKQ